GWDVVVRLADNQEQLALQPPGVVYVGTLGIPILRFFAPDFVQRQVTHPLLVPRRFVEAIVVTSAGRDRRLVKLGMKQDRRRRVLATGGIAVHANARDV